MRWMSSLLGTLASVNAGPNGQLAVRDQSAALTIVQPQQQVGANVPLQVGGAPLVTVSSQPQSSLGQTYTSPSTNAIAVHLT